METEAKGTALLEQMKKSSIEFVDLEFVDIMGTVKACEIPV